MMSKTAYFMKFPLLLIAVLSVTSVSAQMGLALEGDAWATVQQYPVKGRSSHINQKLSFGSFRTVDIDRSWTKGNSSTSGLSQGTPNTPTYKKILTTEHISKKQTLYFSLADSSNNLANGYCVSDVQVENFNIGDHPNSVLNLLLDLSGQGGQSSNMFYVILVDVNTQARWELLLDNQASQMSKDYQGYLAKNESEYYVITPANRIKTKKGKVGTMPFGSAGYHITDKSGRPLAAVSLMDRGIVYLTDLNQEEKLLMAAALTALLLQEVIE
jgi:hypothetical protein